MSKIEVDEVTAPAYWASALVNGDFSGVDETEKAHIEAYIARIAPWYVVDVARDEDGDGREPRFTWSYKIYDPLADCSGGEVTDYIVHKVGGGEQ